MVAALKNVYFFIEFRTPLAILTITEQVVNVGAVSFVVVHARIITGHTTSYVDDVVRDVAADFLTSHNVSCLRHATPLLKLLNLAQVVVAEHAECVRYQVPIDDLNDWRRVWVNDHCRLQVYLLLFRSFLVSLKYDAREHWHELACVALTGQIEII